MEIKMQPMGIWIDNHRGPIVTAKIIFTEQNSDLRILHVPCVHVDKSYVKKEASISFMDPVTGEELQLPENLRPKQTVKQPIIISHIETGELEFGLGTVNLSQSGYLHVDSQKEFMAGFLAFTIIYFT